MSAPSAEKQSADIFSELMGEIIVLGGPSLCVFIGVLVRIDRHFLILGSAGVHDFYDTQTTPDLYVLDAREYGVPVQSPQCVCET